MLNNDLSLSPKGRFQPVADLRPNSLSRILKLRRKELEGTAEFMSVAAMGRHLIDKFGETEARTGAWISSLENGSAKIHRLNPKVRLELLKLYRFTDDEIAQLDERFNLELPDVRNPTSPNVRNLAGLKLATLRIVGHSSGEPLIVLESTLQGYDEDSCVAVLTSGRTLACERVRDEYKNAESLIFSNLKKPGPGKVVLYRFKETDDYLICLYTEKPVQFGAISYDGSRAEVLSIDDPRLEFCGTQFSGTIKERFGADRRSN